MEAARGTRDLDGGREKIEDEGLVQALKRRATGVWVRVFVVTAVGTLLARFLPV